MPRLLMLTNAWRYFTLENVSSKFTPYPNVYLPCYDQPDFLHPGFLMHIDRESVKTIVQAGCFDASDTVLLSQVFPAEIHAFECNPEALATARKNLASQNSIHLVDRAAWNAECQIPFYPVVATLSEGKEIDNPGASSCFKARPDYLSRYEQKETTVAAMRLDTYCAQQKITNVDLLCMDVQGAELRVLEGLGELLHTVRYVITEIEVQPIYYEQSLYPEIDAYLRSYGLRQVAEVYRDPWFSDYLYRRD